MQGWFKLHRELFETELWNDVSTFRLFVFLISQASHKEGIKTKGIELQRGQYIRSYRKLAEDLSYKEGRGYKKYSLSTIKSSVKKLIDAERVNVKETEAGTLFTIINYAKYQDSEGSEEGSPNASNEEVRTNSELTPNEVRTNPEQEQELKNLRIKELKNLSSSSAVAPKNSMVDQDLKCVIDFYEQQSFGMITPHVADKMADWIHDTNKELVIHAMKLAIESGAIKWSYAEGILRNWVKQKLDTVDQVEAYELQRKQQKSTQRRSNTKRPVREEVTPAWFAKRQTEQPPARDSTPIDFNVEAERRKLMAELGISNN